MTSNDREQSREAEHKRRIAKRRERRHQTIIWMMIITIFCMLVMAVIHFSPMLIKKMTLGDEFLPQDLDKQYNQMQDLKKKYMEMQDPKKSNPANRR